MVFWPRFWPQILGLKSPHVPLAGYVDRVWTNSKKNARRDRP